MGNKCCCGCCTLPKDASLPRTVHRPEIRRKYFSENGTSYSTSTGNFRSWIEEVAQLEAQSVICTASNWTAVWPDNTLEDLEHGMNRGLDEAHRPEARIVGNGNIKVDVLGRSHRRAGVESSYLQYIYLIDEKRQIRAIIKFSPSDVPLPWIFPAKHFTDARRLIPYATYSRYGIWEGTSTVEYEALDPRNFSRLL
jgi:hypothetical protein